MMTSQAFILSVMLARVCVSESGWDNHLECQTIVHALSHQAMQRNIPLRRQICAYAPNSCNQEREDDRRWIAFLHPGLRMAPEGFPSIPWEKHRARFAALVVTAYRASMGAIPSGCPGSIHWGAEWCRSCERRMRRYNFHRMNCPNHSNAWYGD